MLRFLLETALEAVSGDEGSLLVLDREASELRFAMTAGNKESEQKLLGQRVPLGKGITGLAAATHEVQVGAPTYRDVEQTEGRSHDPEAVVAAPMLLDDELLGVVTVVSFAAGRRFDSSVARLVGRLAALAAVLVSQHREISGLRARVGLGDGAQGQSRDARLHAIELAASRIGRKRPGSLPQLLTIVQSFEDALEGVRGR